MVTVSRIGNMQGYSAKKVKSAAGRKACARERERGDDKKGLSSATTHMRTGGQSVWAPPAAWQRRVAAALGWQRLKDGRSGEKWGGPRLPMRQQLRGGGGIHESKRGGQRRRPSRGFMMIWREIYHRVSAAPVIRQSRTETGRAPPRSSRRARNRRAPKSCQVSRRKALPKTAHRPATPVTGWSCKAAEFG